MNWRLPQGPCPSSPRTVVLARSPAWRPESVRLRGTIGLNGVAPRIQQMVPDTVSGIFQVIV